MKNFFKQHWLTVLAVIALILVLGFFGAGKIWDGQSKPTPVTQEVIDRLAITLKDPWSIKDGKIYYQDTLMEDVDVASFEIFDIPNGGLSKDKNHVYYVLKIISGADPATFELMDVDYFGLARDKNRVYIHDEVIESADPQTFEKMPSGYFRDKSHVFLRTQQIADADPNTFEPVPITRMGGAGLTDDTTTYAKDANSIYYIPWVDDGPPTKVANSDPASFVPFIKSDGATWYLTDRNNVYHFSQGPLSGSDPATFQVLGSVMTGYSRDARQAYYLATPIKVADLATFKALGDRWAHDKNHIYFEGKSAFNLARGGNPFEKGAMRLRQIIPKDDTAIDYIVNTYYDMTQHYGNYSDFNLFDNDDPDDFFKDDFKGLDRSSFDLAYYVPFRLAFIAPSSPAEYYEFMQPVGPAIGGDVEGKKLLDSETMLVYGSHGSQGYMGPSARECKENGTYIDQWTFKKINGEWKVWELKENIDGWTTNNEGDSEEECKEINQDKIKKYQINDTEPQSIVEVCDQGIKDSNPDINSLPTKNAVIRAITARTELFRSENVSCIRTYLLVSEEARTELSEYTDDQIMALVQIMLALQGSLDPTLMLKTQTQWKMKGTELVITGMKNGSSNMHWAAFYYNGMWY